MPQRVVRLLQRKHLDRGTQRRLPQCLKKRKTVATRQIGHGADAALTPQPGIGKAGNVAHVDASADHAAAFVEVPQGDGHQRACGRKNQGRVQWQRRGLVGSSRPVRAQAAGKFLAGAVAGAGEGKDFAPLRARQLGDEVRRRAKAIDTQSTWIAGQAQRAVADEAGTQQRRQMLGRRPIGQGQAVARIGQRVLGVAAVQLVAREAGVLAQVLASAGAKTALPASPAQPGHTDPLPQAPVALHIRPQACDPGHDLMARHHGQYRVGQLAIQQVQIGTAHTTGLHRQQQLTRTGNRPR